MTALTVAALVVLPLAAVDLLSAQYAGVAETAPRTGCDSRRSGAGWPMLARLAPIAAAGRAGRVTGWPGGSCSCICAYVCDCGPGRVVERSALAG